MSENSNDSVYSHHVRINKQDKSQINLCDVSKVGKIWDKHKANAELISKYYMNASEGSFERYAMRVKKCSEWLEF